MNRVLDLACQDQDHVRAIRRDLHRYPETGMELPRTRKVVREELLRCNVLHVEEVAGGIVADLASPISGPRVALRADMDALPMAEHTGLDFASTVPGTAHMCGHDAHTAMLLGAARVLSTLRHELPGPVRFIFQPNEEIQPGGAAPMIQAGCLNGVDEIFGLHVWPTQPTGWIGTRSGPCMARPDDFTITLTGRGGHASTPQHCVDPVLAGCELVTRLHSIISRRVPALDAAVLSVTRFQAGTAYNIIPDTAILQGTVRSLREETGTLIQTEMRRHIKAQALASGVEAHLHYTQGFPVLVNHEKSTRKVLRVLNVIATLDGDFPPVMGGEDFSHYLRRVPGCFFFLGCGLQQGSSGLHSSTFILDERCLPLGVAALATLALAGADQGFS